MDCQEYKKHVKSRKRFVLWYAVIPKEIPVKISGRQERAYYLWRDGIWAVQIGSIAIVLAACLLLVQQYEDGILHLW